MNDTNLVYNEFLKNEFGINERIIDLVSEKEKELLPYYVDIDKNTEVQQAKVLKAFQDSSISDSHFGWNTGYGYDDMGREAVERVFAKVFCSEKALVRPNIVNGTHAISLVILGLLKRGDKLIYCTGEPYDTLNETIKYAQEDGIEYEAIDLLDKGELDYERIKASLTENVKMIAVQRSKGYSLRKSISVNQIKTLKSIVEECGLHIIIMVDNCYCEFVEPSEPISAGADIICGSLIKNPGGGLALTGGYLCGNEDLIDIVSCRLTCPGIGAECGLTFGQNRAVLEGLFQAPRVTAGALKGAMLCCNMFKSLGFKVSPDYFEGRSDIIQSVVLGSPDMVQAFCSGIQKASPVDSHVTPIPSPMAGYDDDIIMAAGTFVQGSSIELSCDGPLREPYAVYFQGGLSYEHSKLGVIFAAQSLYDAGLLEL